MSSMLKHICRFSCFVTFLVITMSLFRVAWTTLLFVLACSGTTSSIGGIEALIKRRLPQHADDFTFRLSPVSSTADAKVSSTHYDGFSVSTGENGKIEVEAVSTIGLASGLRWYLANVAHVDVHWFFGSRLHLAPKQLPRLNETYEGFSTVPWRYHFNTVTFSYTAAFWDWNDWELQLDWMAFRGINLPLAWVGFEKILVDVFHEAGFTDADLSSFLSGPAFQAWNRFGNIQGSWNSDLPKSWIDSQFELNKRIVARMVELGMTPVLPCFTGFVPVQIEHLYPNASFVNGSTWGGFERRYTNVTFLEPNDPLFASLQKSFISKQTAAYGNVTHIYTLDQYNENHPHSGDLDYLRDVASNTIQSLKDANPDSMWLMQGWLFFAAQDFWTNERVEAYLSGVEDEDMLMLDLWSESQPQWQRTDSYFGKRWIWCQLRVFGGNMGLYGQIANITTNPVEALANSSSMVGMGSVMEGQEGNQVMYDLLMDQAMSGQAIQPQEYFEKWVAARYGPDELPQSLRRAWDMLRQTVYNHNVSSDATMSDTLSVTKSIFELAPNTTGLLNRFGQSTKIEYNPSDLVDAWNEFYGASTEQPSLCDNDAYTFDLTDITRQVLANAFYPLYTDFITAANSSLTSDYSPTKAAQTGRDMLSLLQDLDAVLSASEHDSFHLSSWIAKARSWADPDGTADPSAAEEIARFYEYNARNQITRWGPRGEIRDYASKQWGGLIRSYYVPRWQRFVEYTLNSTTSPNGGNAALDASLRAFEEAWQFETWGEKPGESYAPPRKGEFLRTIAEVVARWPAVFDRSSNE